MRHCLSLKTALALALGMPAMLAAQDEQKSRDSGSLFEQLDSNKDGAITKDEVPEGRQRLFARLINQADENKDGKLSRDEFAAGLKDRPRDRAPGERDQPNQQSRPEGQPGQPRGGAGPFGPAFFERIDANEDGKITKEEIRDAERIPQGARDRITAVFDRLDRDGDGTVTKAEFDNARNAAPPGSGLSGPGGVMPMPGMALVRALDADGNGEISAAEIENAAAALKKLDKNGDGRLTRDELGGGGAGRRGGPAGDQPGIALLERLRELDKNNDGKWSKDELPPRLQERFDSLDANKDGFLDREEVRAAAPRGRGGPRGPGKQPGEGGREGASSNSSRPEQQNP